MAILCSNCGKTLEKDDAQFCNNCGASITPHTSKPQSAFGSQNSVSPSKQPEILSTERNNPVTGSAVDKSAQPAIRVQVVKPSEQNIPSSQEQTKKPVEQKPSIRVEVVKSAQNDQAHVSEQLSQQPSAYSVSRPTSLSSSPEQPPADQKRNPVSWSGIEEKQGKKDFGKSTSIAHKSAEVHTSVETEVKTDETKDQTPAQKPEPKQPEKSVRSSRTSAMEQRRKSSAVEWPTPMTHVSITDRSGGEKESEKPVEEKKLQPPPVTEPDARELRVKVWEQQDAEESQEAAQTSLEKQPAPFTDLPSTPPVHTPLASGQHQLEDEAIEDKPTQLLEVKPDQKQSKARSVDDIENQSTAQLPPSKPVTPVSHVRNPVSQAGMRDNIKVHKSDGPQSLSGISNQEDLAVFPQPAYQPATVSNPASLSGSQQRDELQRPLQQQAIPAPSSQSRKGFPVKIVALLLVILVILVTGSWVLFAKPFDVPAVTQTQLPFSDATLGVSLQYPNGWSYQKDSAHSAVHFYDSSRTAQVNVTVADTGDMTKLMQQQATQLGMTSVKSQAPATFAGSTWQSERGSVLQNGANYACTLFVTTHAGHIVVLTQLAPQSTYNDEESVVFSSLRTSMQFI